MPPSRSAATPEMPPPRHDRVVFIAGYGNSGPGHWQRIWHESMPGSLWIEQEDWDAPDRDRWVAALERQVAARPGPVLLVAHSLGCLAAVEWSGRVVRPVRGALLVAVPDPRAPGFPDAITGFGEPRARVLSFPSVVVSSADDPYVTVERSKAFARAWGSAWFDVGARGHINANSGLGSWPEGRELLSRLTG